MAWGYTTKARPGPRGGKGQQGETGVTVLGMRGWMEERGEGRETSRDLPGLLQDGREESCSRECRRISLLLAQPFIRHHLVLLKVCTAGTGLPLSLPLAS